MCIHVCACMGMCARVGCWHSAPAPDKGMSQILASDNGLRRNDCALPPEELVAGIINSPAAKVARAPQPQDG